MARVADENLVPCTPIFRRYRKLGGLLPPTLPGSGDAIPNHHADSDLRPAGGFGATRIQRTFH
jgi:hypothetical protein